MGNNKLFRLWVASSMRDFHMTSGVVAVASFVIGNISHNPNMHIVSDIVTIVAIAHYFIHGYFHRQQKFISNNQNTYSLPKKKIARTGGMFLVGFMVFVFVGMTIAREIYTGTLVAKVKMFIMYILATVFGVIFEFEGLGDDSLKVKDTMSLLENMNQVAAKQEAPWENFMNSLQTILMIVGVVFLLVLCVSVVVNYVKRLIHDFKVDVKGDGGRDVSDRETRLGRRMAKRENIFDFSPTAKTRRLYRKVINRQRRQGQSVPEWMSPAEIEAMVALPKEENYHELHRIYEKARYSEQGCTDEDAQRAKSLKV